MIDNPCACCSEYDPDIGAPCFYYNKSSKCPIGWEPSKEELERVQLWTQGNNLESESRPPA